MTATLLDFNNADSSHLATGGIKDLTQLAEQEIAPQAGAKFVRELELSADDQKLMDAGYQGQEGCAGLFVERNRELFLFDHAMRQWYEFSEHFYRPDRIGQVLAELDYEESQLRDFAMRLTEQTQH